MQFCWGSVSRRPRSNLFVCEERFLPELLLLAQQHQLATILTKRTFPERRLAVLKCSCGRLKQELRVASKRILDEDEEKDLHDKSRINVVHFSSNHSESQFAAKSLNRCSEARVLYNTCSVLLSKRSKGRRGKPSKASKCFSLAYRNTLFSRICGQICSHVRKARGSSWGTSEWTTGGNRWTAAEAQSGGFLRETSRFCIRKKKPLEVETKTGAGAGAGATQSQCSAWLIEVNCSRTLAPNGGHNNNNKMRNFLAFLLGKVEKRREATKRPLWWS